MKLNFLLFLSFLLVLVTASCSDDDDHTIASEACFTFPSEEHKAGVSVQMSNCSENATLYLWKFGDGQSSTEKEPAHTYMQQGTYSISLVAGVDENGDGLFDADNQPDSVIIEIEVVHNHLAAELTIYTASSWTTENTELTTVPGATVDFYEENSLEGEPAYTVMSDDNGKVQVYDPLVETYYFIVTKNDESNIVGGYQIMGVFNSQSDIDNASVQSGASVGGLRYVDLNMDGIINSGDKTTLAYLPVLFEGTSTKEVVIGK